LKALPWVIFLIVISALTSVAAALSVVTWFLPNMIPQAQISIDGRIRVPKEINVDPMLDRQIKQSILKIYDKRQKIDSSFYKDSAFIAHAAILSSDGWAVIADTGKIPAKAFLEAIDYRGLIYEITQVISDEFGKLKYLKIDNSGFRVMALPQWNSSAPDQPLWAVAADGYREIFLDQLEKNEPEKQVFPIWEPQYYYKLSPDTGKASMILNTSGGLAGFFGSGGRLIPSWPIANQLSKILSASNPSYFGLPYQGYFVRGAQIESVFEPLYGFYVDRSPTKSASSTIGKGDIITAIDGEKIVEYDLARRVITAQNTINLEVFRKGEKIDILVEKSLVGNAG